MQFVGGDVANVITRVEVLSTDTEVGEVMTAADVGVNVVVSRPEREGEAEAEAHDAKVEGTIDCKEKSQALVNAGKDKEQTGGAVAHS